MIERGVFQHAGRLLAGWRRTLILTHQRPDGDGLGAVVAMKRVIEAGGRQATAMVYEEVPGRYVFLADPGFFERWSGGDVARLDARFDGLLVLDTSSWAQVEPAAGYLRVSSRPRIIVDHHATGDDLSGQAASIVGLIDSTAASTCTLVREWCQAIGASLDAQAAQALLVGMTTDTGWFRFSNTDGRTLAAAAALVEESGARPEELFARLYESWSPARLRLKALALASLELHADNTLAVMHLDPDMFRQAGATSADSEELVNEPMATASVAVSVLLIQQDDGRIRANFRSKSPQVCGRDVDVASVAESFGGGGHRRASGAKIEGDMAGVRERVVKALMEASR
ncbi:MAG TPA: bifunctional oligoribonuclease/PAP phosphatase NrnA [Phycisphaerae bacterium]|nr:bifunctional oligoribonuclease/PAP phosphatase NrnA [Phycisphaerae bacterium]HRY67665.1 bifunctional oligoribonuclease/PAP phosphatase NrnA [Phycisphaerae bacterium]HSA25052.1 bifunctional oligoribonuclease/PAP phosphatase NrnA [Phycisphaerae bacterium]